MTERGHGSAQSSSVKPKDQDYGRASLPILEAGAIGAGFPRPAPSWPGKPHPTSKIGSDARTGIDFQLLSRVHPYQCV